MVGGSLLYLEEPEWNRWNRWTRWTNAEVDRKVTWTNRATLRVFTPGEADRVVSPAEERRKEEPATPGKGQVKTQPMSCVDFR